MAESDELDKFIAASGADPGAIFGTITEPPPTAEQVAASIGCKPEQIIRTAHNLIKSRLRNDGRDIYTSFVDEGDPERAAVYETVWPQ